MDFLSQLWELRRRLSKWPAPALPCANDTWSFRGLPEISNANGFSEHAHAMLLQKEELIVKSGKFNAHCEDFVGYSSWKSC